MNDFYVKVFNVQSGNESAFSKRKYYFRRNLIRQHLPVKEKVKKEANRMSKGNVLDTSTSVDIQEKLKTGGSLIQFYKGVLYREGFKLTHY